MKWLKELLYAMRCIINTAPVIQSDKFHWILKNDYEEWQKARKGKSDKYKIEDL